MRFAPVFQAMATAVVTSSQIDCLYDIPDTGDDVLVAAGGADVGELPFAAGVDHEVVDAVVLADDHALVDGGAGADEELPARLQVEQGVGSGGARAVARRGPGPASLLPRLQDPTD